MADKKSKYQTSGTPKMLDENAWFYRERSGILVCIHVDDVGTVKTKIPWRFLGPKIEKPKPRNTALRAHSHKKEG